MPVLPNQRIVCNYRGTLLATWDRVAALTISVLHLFPEDLFLAVSAPKRRNLSIVDNDLVVLRATEVLCHLAQGDNRDEIDLFRLGSLYWSYLGHVKLD